MTALDDYHTIYIPPRQNSWRQAPPNVSDLSATVFYTGRKKKKTHQITPTMLSPFSVWGSAIEYWFDIWFCQVHGRAWILRAQRDKLACVTLRMAPYPFADVLTFLFYIQAMPFLLLFVAKCKVNNWWSSLWKAVIEQGHGWSFLPF